MELTINDLKELLGSQSAPKPCPFEVGTSYHIRSVTNFHTGRIKAIVGDFIVLEDAAWIAATGRFTQALRTGELSEVEPIDDDVIISVLKHVANELAEESGKVSLLSFYDNPEGKNLVQFKMRRSHAYKKFDLRDVLDIFSISNGGGHEGAIGFRFPVGEIEDVPEYVQGLIERLEEIIG